MPPYVLTEQEKAEFRRKYIENVRLANTYLSDRNKIKLDLNAFDKKINDPKMQRLYKKGLELHNITVEKIRISHEIFNGMKDQKIKGARYDMNRLIHSEIIPSSDPEAMAYNEQKIRDYVLHPQAETERRYRELLNLDISDVAKFANAPDAKNFFLDFYEKNSAAIDLANETKLILSHCDPKTPALEQYVNQIGPNFETLANIQNVVNLVRGDEFFTFPDTLTEEQYEELFSNSAYQLENEELARAQREKIVRNQAMEGVEKQFKNFFTFCKQNNVDLSNGASLASVVATDRTTGNKISYARYSSIEDWKKEHPNRDVNVVKKDSATGVMINIDTLQTTILSEEEVNQIKQITTVDHTLEDGYVSHPMPERFKKGIVEQAKDDVLYNFALDNEKNLGDIASKGGISGLAESFAGNWKERTFNTTSQEYKIFKANLKNFENPNNAAYNQPQPVADSARAYLAHKGVTTVEEARRLPPPGDSRALLCFSVIKTFDDQYGLVRHDNVRQNVVDNNNINRQPAILDPRVLDDDFNTNNISMDSNDKNLSMDDALDNEIDNPNL